MRWIAIALLLGGCAAGVQIRVSDFDGTREVYMEPAPVPTPGAMVIYVQLGAHWSSADPDVVRLIAQTPQGFTSIRGLEFSINGEVTSLSSPVLFTEFEGRHIQNVAYRESSRAFTAPIDFVRALASSEDARVRLLVGQNEYYEARLLTEGMNARAHRGLNQFLESVWGG